MLTSDQKIKINEKVQGFKEAADFLPHGVIHRILWGCSGSLGVCCLKPVG